MLVVRAIVNLFVGLGLLVGLPALVFGLAGGSDTGVVASVIVFVCSALVVLTWTIRWSRNHWPAAGDQS